MNYILHKWEWPTLYMRDRPFWVGSGRTRQYILLKRHTVTTSILCLKLHSLLIKLHETFCATVWSQNGGSIDKQRKNFYDITAQILVHFPQILWQTCWKNTGLSYFIGNSLLDGLQNFMVIRYATYLTTTLQSSWSLATNKTPQEICLGASKRFLMRGAHSLD